MDPTDSLIGVVTADLVDGAVTSNARVYEVGRRKQADGDSDQDEDDDDSDEDDEAEVGLRRMMGARAGRGHDGGEGA